VEKIIPRNTSIPVARAQEFTTYQDGQNGMIVHVVQGEREMVGQCRSLARFELTGIPPMTAGAARVRVTFAVDADGLLTVSAREATTGIEQKVEVKPSYGLNDEDMAAMLRDSMVHAREDMKARVLAEARVEAGRVLNAIGAALAADGDLLDATERGWVLEAVARLEKVLPGSEREAINAAAEALEQATKPFAEKRMDRGIRAALRGVTVDRLDGKE
ncbi:MAG: Hsp70 family protein, partial [Pseudomonadota bacterium]